MPKILIIDDEPRITSLFQKSFDPEEGFYVFTANQGEKAIQMITEITPHLLILDWRLKGRVEGKDVLIFSKKEYPMIPVYVVTASIPHAKEIRSLGADKCLFKPCEGLKKMVMESFCVQPAKGMNQSRPF